MNVLITGCTSGLGLALAQTFYSMGFEIYGIGKERPSDSPSNALPPSTTYFKFDFETDDPAHLASRLSQTKIDILINNAGINAICPFEQLTEDFINRILRVNTLWPVLLTQALLRGGNFGMEACVVNVISDAAWKPMRHSLAYNMSKAALRMATEQMARELTKPHHLTVLGVCPGKMHSTGMSRYIDQKVCETRGWTPAQAREYYEANCISGQEADPLNMARTIFDLATSPLNRSLSGAIIPLVSNQ